jgi:hypothetical protein
MQGKRIEMHRLQELVRLHRMGTRCREVSRLLKMGTATELAYRRALKKEALLDGDPRELPSPAELKAAVMKHRPPKPPPQRISTVEPYAEEIIDMLEKDAEPTSVYDALRLKYEDFEASLSAVKRFCLRHKKNEGIAPEAVAIPVENDPGQIAQVDFGYCGRLYDALERRMRKSWVFVMVLGFSRHMFADIVFGQRTETGRIPILWHSPITPYFYQFFEIIDKSNGKCKIQ